MPGPDTTKYALPTLADDFLNDFPGTFNDAMTTLDALIATAASGTLAARPAAGKLGRFYYVSSGPEVGQFAVDVGVAWVVLVLPEAWTAPAFATTWVNDGDATTPPAGYFKHNGIVYLRGKVEGGGISGGGGPTIFTLPVGYRPGFRLRFPAVRHTGELTMVDVLASGVVQVPEGVGDVSLDGIIFRAEG